MAGTEPKVHGMPRAETTYQVHPFGSIRLGGKCKSDYRRINTYHDEHGRIVALQAAALRSFREAEDALGYPIVLTGSHRSCELQAQLYRSDKSRFAPPNGSYHPRGLAIDVSQAQSAARLKEIHRELTARRWYQARSDEPWHYSMGGEG